MFPRALTAAALLAAAGTVLSMPPEPAPLARPNGSGAAYPYQPFPVVPAAAALPAASDPPAQPAVPVGTTPIPGVPGAVLLTPSDTNLGTFAGLRAAVGGWLNRHKDVGVEATGLLLENRAVRHTFSPVANLPPGLAVPPLA